LVLRNLGGHHEKNQEQKRHVDHRGELEPDFVFLAFVDFHESE
jgi:hypothetical protein